MSSKSPEASAIYHEINAPAEEPYYYPESDFPFLGVRILNLQKFVKARHPHDARALWYDRSNPNTWWTFWVSRRMISLFYIGSQLTIIYLGCNFYWRRYAFAGAFPVGISDLG
jgi:hypothetical protein